jgi:hypothetical protein
LGIGIIISLLTAGTAAENQEEDPCSEEKMAEMIGNRTVAQVVYESPLGDRINGRRVVGAGQPWLQRVGAGSVAQYASWACKGSPFPPIVLYPPGRDFDAIADGQHRFVASRLVSIPVTVASQYRRTSRLNYDRRGNFLGFEWSEFEWSN